MGHSRWDTYKAKRLREMPALSRIEGGGGIPDIATLLRLGVAMGVRFRVELVTDDDVTEVEPLTVHHRRLASA